MGSNKGATKAPIPNPRKRKLRFGKVSENSMKAITGGLGADTTKSSGSSTNLTASPFAASLLPSAKQRQEDVETVEDLETEIAELESMKERLQSKQSTISRLSEDDITEWVLARGLLAQYMTNSIIADPAQAREWHHETVRGVELLAAAPLAISGTDWVPQDFRVPDLDYGSTLEGTEDLRGD